MTCGIICRLDPDGHSPWTELDRIQACIDRLPGTHYDEPKPDPFERWLMLFFGVAFMIGGLAILGLFIYGVVSTLIAAV